jgi:hypothetical protein
VVSGDGISQFEDKKWTLLNSGVALVGCELCCTFANYNMPFL